MWSVNGSLNCAPSINPPIPTIIGGTLLSPINQTEYGGEASGPETCEQKMGAWTGVSGSGELYATNCMGWTGGQASGHLGFIGGEGVSWTETVCYDSCFNGAPLYCFQQ